MAQGEQAVAKLARRKQSAEIKDRGVTFQVAELHLMQNSRVEWQTSVPSLYIVKR